MLLIQIALLPALARRAPPLLGANLISLFAHLVAVAIWQIVNGQSSARSPQIRPPQSVIVSAAPNASVETPPSLDVFLADLARSFSEPARFRGLAGETGFDGADPAARRMFGTPRVVHVAGDERSAVVLLSAAVAEENSGDQTSASRNWSGLYRVSRSETGWKLGDRIPFGVNRILEHRIAVAVDPATGLTASDNMTTDVAGGDGFAIMLNRDARISSLAVDGDKARYDFQNGLLWVDTANGRHKISIAYQINVEHPAAGGNSAAFGPDAGHVRNQYYWHPFFGFGEENGRAPIIVQATIPERYRLALGLAQTERVVNGTRIVEAHSAGPVDAVTMAYDSEWSPRTIQAGGVTLTLFARSDFTPSLDVIDASFTRAMRVLSARFGAPPLDSISIIQGRARGRKGWHFFSNQGIFAGTQGGDPVRATEFPVRVFLGHEIAHLWTRPTGWARNYLGEGWATYAESLILADQFGPDTEMQFWRDQARLQRQSQENMRTALNDDPRNSGVAYAKGAWTLRMVERLVGCDTFDRALRAYVAAPAENASYDDFLAGFGTQRGRVETFLKPWVSEKGLPSFEVKRAGGKLVVTQIGPEYFLPAFDIRLAHRDGVSQIVRVDIAGKTTVTDLGPDVTAVALDPFEDFLLDRRVYDLSEKASGAVG